MKLHLGVLDVAYSEGNKTTGDVAEILEKKYHVMELWAEETGAEVIAAAYENSARDAVEAVFAGAPVYGISLTAAASQELEAEFRKFLDQKKLDFVEPGVPTEASLKGVSHRRKHPNAKGNPPRPSFIDRGLYQASFRAWSDD